MIAMKENTTSSQTGAKMRHQGTLGSVEHSLVPDTFFKGEGFSQKLYCTCIWECAVVRSVVFTHAVHSWHLFLFFFFLA